MAQLLILVGVVVVAVCAWRDSGDESDGFGGSRVLMLGVGGMLVGLVALVFSGVVALFFRGVG